jgi:flap endonuclease-1
MGIKNLSVLLNQKCKLAINSRKLDCYQGMKIGIDVSIFLYKYLYNNDDHIEGLTRLILRLLKNQIIPVFVFDGKPPKEKDETLQYRREKRDFLSVRKNVLENSISIEKTNYDNFKNILIENVKNISETYILEEDEIKMLFEKSSDEIEKEIEKVAKKIIYVTHIHIENAKKLFDLFGIQYIHEQCEAESLMSVLCKESIIDGCISEDSDILVNGGALFLRNFNADKNTIDEYCLEGILNNLNLTLDQFIDMCILIGCDYTTKINGMGPMTAYKLILKYNNIEKVLENNNKFIIPENFDYVTARNLFKNPVSKDILNNINKEIFLSKPNIEELTTFLKSSKLKDKYFNEIEKNLMNYYLNIDGIYNYEKNMNKNESKKITDFFTKNK